MKKIYLSLIASFVFVQFSYAQSTFPTDGSNVGIGTTAPVAKLEINSGASTTPLRAVGPNGYLLIDNVGSGESYYKANAFHQFQGTTGTALLTILGSGNVGIGTTNPSRPLDVNGFIQTNIGMLYNNGKTWDISNSGTNLNINETGADCRLSFQSGGNIGIGTTSPFARLHVQNADTNTGTIAIGNTTYPGLITSSASSGEFRIDNRSSAAAGFITFYPNGQNTTIGSEAMRITTTGNVGIGTTSPFARLHVQNADTNTGTIAIGNTTYPGLITSSSSSGEFIIDNRSSAAAGFITFYPNGQNTTIGSEAMRITTTGNVGIGTTSPTGKFEVYDGNGTGVIAYFGANGINNAKGLYLSRSGVNTNPVNLQGTQVGVGATDISLQAEGGNVGIGTIDPKGYKLAVAGNMVAEQVTVKLRTNWPDYVFNKDYTLTPLSDVKTYIDQNHHLPEVPSEKEITEKGLNLGEMNKLLMKKVEELTLYLIEKDKQQKEQTDINQSQQKQIDQLKEQVNVLIKTLKSNEK